MFFKRRKTIQDNTQRETVFKGYNYSTEDDYLGKQGTVSSADGKYNIVFYASAHDGVGLIIKQNTPYKHLFKYTDLNYFIVNDDFDFSTIISLLNKTVETNNKEGYEKAFTELERLIQDRVIDYIQEREQRKCGK